MAKLLLGKEVTDALNAKLQERTAALRAKGVTPTLGIIRVGADPSDLSYEIGETGVHANKLIPTWVRPSIMRPAVITPRNTAGKAFFSRMSKNAAARLPVHAPVPGNGMATKSHSPTC